MAIYRKGQHSIRINDQWRICFKWRNKNAYDVEIVDYHHGRRRITADTSLRLAKYFKMYPQFWLGLQMDYDIDVASDQIADRLDQEIREYQPTA